MAINLIKGQKISLDKESGSTLTAITMGLGWDAVQVKKGFLKSLMGGGSSNIDLDASCAMFDADKKEVDFVWFSQLRSKDGSIIHTGDNVTGEGDGDDEQILVNLANIPAHVKYLVFTVNSFQGQTFDMVENAFCRLVDNSTQKEIARYTLSGGGNYTAMVMTKLYRHENEWKMQAIGESATAQVVKELIPTIVSIL